MDLVVDKKKMYSFSLHSVHFTCTCIQMRVNVMIRKQFITRAFPGTEIHKLQYNSPFILYYSLHKYSLTSPYDTSVIRTPVHYGQFVWSQKCQKSYIPYLYNMDTSVKRTLGSVPLVSILKRFDCTRPRTVVFFPQSVAWRAIK